MMRPASHAARQCQTKAASGRRSNQKPSSQSSSAMPLTYARSGSPRRQVLDLRDHSVRIGSDVLERSATHTIGAWQRCPWPARTARRRASCWPPDTREGVPPSGPAVRLHSEDKSPLTLNPVAWWSRSDPLSPTDAGSVGESRIPSLTRRHSQVYTQFGTPLDSRDSRYLTWGSVLPGNAPSSVESGVPGLYPSQPLVQARLAIQPPGTCRAPCRVIHSKGARSQAALVGGRVGPKAGSADGPTDGHRSARSPKRALRRAA